MSLSFRLNEDFQALMMCSLSLSVSTAVTEETNGLSGEAVGEDDVDAMREEEATGSADGEAEVPPQSPSKFWINKHNYNLHTTASQGCHCFKDRNLNPVQFSFLRGYNYKCMLVIFMFP